MSANVVVVAGEVVIVLDALLVAVVLPVDVPVTVCVVDSVTRGVVVMVVEVVLIVVSEHPIALILAHGGQVLHGVKRRRGLLRFPPQLLFVGCAGFAGCAELD